MWCFFYKFLKETAAALFQPLAMVSMALALSFWVFAGPFGTFVHMTVLERLVYFFPLFAFTAVLAAMIYVGFLHLFADSTHRRRRFYGSGLFVLIFTPSLYHYNVVVADHLDHQLDNLYVTFGLVGAISIFFTIAADLLKLGNGEPPSAVERPLLAQRIPEIGDASVYRITVNDHYVQVFLSDGREEQLLMRFGDAISELKAIPGIVTHRSHWVAAAKVTKMIKVNGRELIELDCGTRVPVSRRYRSEVVEAIARQQATA